MDKRLSTSGTWEACWGLRWRLCLP